MTHLSGHERSQLLLLRGDYHYRKATNWVRSIRERRSDLRSKTGRFGLGFNTSYNATDYPSFLSREWMFCFDPHGDAIAERPDEAGGRWIRTCMRKGSRDRNA